MTLHSDSCIRICFWQINDTYMQKLNPQTLLKGTVQKDTLILAIITWQLNHDIHMCSRVIRFQQVCNCVHNYTLSCARTYSLVLLVYMPSYPGQETANCHI